ncbi:cystatin-like [Erpetoichthys calabaricus]|uniref:cystatin-like n=1 Tax=Erpetoichthys calabaricus TaxID=27687 RepID=UPI00109FDC73|nr:cystatin-like [Erpetoichthys calabaricus]
MASWCQTLCFLLSTVVVVLATGEIEEVSPTREDVQDAARYAVATYNTISSNDYDYKLLKVIAAKEQVVAGLKYFLKVEVGETQCKKGSSNVESCPLTNKTFNCQFVVFTQPWRNYNQLLESNCQASQ